MRISFTYLRQELSVLVWTLFIRATRGPVGISDGGVLTLRVSRLGRYLHLLARLKRCRSYYSDKHSANIALMHRSCRSFVRSTPVGLKHHES